MGGCNSLGMSSCRYDPGAAAAAAAATAAETDASTVMLPICFS